MVVAGRARTATPVQAITTFDRMSVLEELRHQGANETVVAEMSTVRIALANVRVPATPQESVLLATTTVAEAGR